MDKIDLLSINFGRELVEAIDPRLLRTPVILLLLVGRQFTDLLDVRAILPICAG